MKHLQKFEEVSHLDRLKKEKELRDSFEDETFRQKEEESRKRSGKFLPNLQDEARRPKAIDIELERKEILQMVTDGLLADLNMDPGYRSFKEELLDFLKEFPKE